jgi:hypothetical protein
MDFSNQVVYIRNQIVANVKMDENIFFWLGWGASIFKLVKKYGIL